VIVGPSLFGLNFGSNIQLRAHFYRINQDTSWNEKELENAIPSVMSASGVTKTGDTSDGSTAAKLEVARPKSPTTYNVMKCRFQKNKIKLAFAISLAI
jgi:hypothetical protein